MTIQPQPLKSGRLPVNGISMYYEIHGEAAGTPLVLLHGGGSTIDVTYGRILPFFARQRGGYQETQVDIVLDAVVDLLQNVPSR